MFEIGLPPKACCGLDGVEGVAKTALERPNIVLMDIQMPVLDGYDATRQIKALPGCAAIPIITVSSFAMKGDEELARAAACEDCVTKPYSPVRLLRVPRHSWRYVVKGSDAKLRRREALRDLSRGAVD